MKDIKKPEFMKAALTARSHNAVLELMIALLVFFVGDVVVGILQAPVMVIYLLGNKEYLRMILSNSIDFNKIMNMMMNMPDWITVVSLLLEAGIIVVFILYCRIFEKRKAVTMGFRKQGAVIQYLKGIAIGVAAFLAAYVICTLTGSIEFIPSASNGFTGFYIFGFLLGYLVQGMAEEVICRGYLLVSLSRRYSVVSAVIMSAVFFSMLHGMNAGVGFLAFLNLLLFGLFMGLLFIRCENIWIVGAVHSIWNFLQGNIFGIQVSGQKLQPSLFTSEFLEGKEIINGGSFGVEGGMAVTLVLAVAIALLFWDMSKHGYFVKAEPVVNPYDKYPYGGYGKQSPNGQGYQGNPNQNNNFKNPDNYYPNQNVAQGKDVSVNQNASFESEEINLTRGENGSKKSVLEKSYENMGLNPEETPWHPQEENPNEKKMTGFDQSYFKD